MRKLRSRKTPRSSGIVGASPSRCSRTEAPVPGRVHPLGDLRELKRIAQEDQVAGRRAHRQRVGERDLAGLVDDEVVERAVQVWPREEPGRSGEELDVAARTRERRVVRVALDELAVVLGLGVPGRRLLEPLEAHARVPGDRLDLVEQVVDGLVALRGDPDPLAAGQQVHDDPGAGPGLAGPGRALEEQIARVEAERERLHLGEVDRLDPCTRRRGPGSGAAHGRESPGAPDSAHRRR